MQENVQLHPLHAVCYQYKSIRTLRSSRTSLDNAVISFITFAWRFSATSSCWPAKSLISFIICLNALHDVYLENTKKSKFKKNWLVIHLIVKYLIFLCASDSCLLYSSSAIVRRYKRTGNAHLRRGCYSVIHNALNWDDWRTEQAGSEYFTASIMRWH